MPSLSQILHILESLLGQQVSGSQVACTSASLARGHPLPSRTCWRSSSSEQPTTPSCAPAHPSQERGLLEEKQTEASDSQLAQKVHRCPQSHKSDPTGAVGSRAKALWGHFLYQNGG